jgi:hypothetical protein
VTIEDEDKIDLIRQLLTKLTWNEMEAVAKSLEQYRSGNGEYSEEKITGAMLVAWAEEAEIEL